MSGFSSVNYVFVVLFTIFGAFMAIIGLSVLFSWPSNEMEWIIALLSLLSAYFLLKGAWSTWRSNKAKQAAEIKESLRLRDKFKAPSQVQSNEIKPDQFPIAEKDEEKRLDQEPKILGRWIYPKSEWKQALNKMTKKTKREELYTAFWFPVFGAIVFWSKAIYGFIGGIVLGYLYIRFRAYYLQKQFALSSKEKEAEVIISDAYLRVNGNFIHYADGHYYLKNLSRDKDAKLGDFLLFNIGWVTSKGLPAEMDLYLPIPKSKQSEAESILKAYSSK